MGVREQKRLERRRLRSSSLGTLVPPAVDGPHSLFSSVGGWVSEEDPFGHILNDLSDLLIREGEDEEVEVEEWGHHLIELRGVALAWPQVDKDGAAVAQKQHREVGGAGGTASGARRRRACAALQTQ